MKGKEAVRMSTGFKGLCLKQRTFFSRLMIQRKSRKLPLFNVPKISWRGFRNVIGVQGLNWFLAAICSKNLWLPTAQHEHSAPTKDQALVCELKVNSWKYRVGDIGHSDVDIPVKIDAQIYATTKRTGELQPDLLAYSKGEQASRAFESLNRTVMMGYVLGAAQLTHVDFSPPILLRQLGKDRVFWPITSYWHLSILNLGGKYEMVNY